ncbi:hypothetical protein H0E87_017601 [Populus deltoides]|uniref:CBM20 domain-containing protein n=1 Tax=Populus deltoides TaxID=3696 RepID=A0A8T2Y0V2_POPDE|nr:hypothetical protein H0E87_017601 [Populus deltoides]
MGTGLSKDADGSSHGNEGEENPDHAGGQLYVSLKMENYRLKAELIPHVYGSVPLVGSWDSSKALSMEPESASMWELSFVVPPNHETLDFKFLLKPKYSNSPCVVEEGPNRLLTRGTLQGESRLAVFKNGDVTVEFRVFIKADRVSPFDLAASWRVYQENLQPSTVRGIPDVSINSVPMAGIENGSPASLELDLEHYVVPAPSTSANSAFVYAANNTENPRFSNVDCPGNASYSFKDSGVSADQPTTIKEMEVVIPDPSKVYSGSGMVESKSVGTFSSLQKQDGHRGLFVDRGVGSPKVVKSSSSSAFSFDLKLDTETKNSMPAAAGAVAAGAVADQMLGPKEDRHLAIVLVGLPARGKTFTAAKLTRYLRWLGHDTKHFNVGKYRRLKHGANQSADFFRADNPEGMEARNEVAALAMDDMIAWMQEGGQVGIFDATNSTRKRRNMLMKMAEGKCKIWTSTLQRTIITASPIIGFPKIQWRALDEINAGVCDGMTYEEIKKNMPEEYEARRKDKLRYRYPRGESYLDVIQRLEPVIIELERQRAPVVVISHQAVLRALYAYFADRPLKEIPHIEVPLHTIIEIQMGVTGVQEKRYKLMD